MRLNAIVAITLAGLTSSALAQTPPVPSFTEETATSGIDSTYSGDWQYMVGGGAATFDCNADGFPDLLVAGGEGKASFYRNESAMGGALKFAREVSGLELDAVTGAYPLDVDSDGFEDVLLLRVGESVLMRGLGACKFERANEAWGFKGGDAWWTAAAATWEHSTTWPTIAMGSYVDRTQDIEPWGTCTDNWLQRPAADGKGFAAPLPLKPSYCALSMLFTDWNRSGTASLRIANDREYYVGGQEQMWKVPSDGGAPALYTAAEGWKPLKIWGMGIAEADVTGDGYPDYFITSMADNKLQTLSSLPVGGVTTPDYKDVAYPRGASAPHPYKGDDRRPSTAWHTQFEDVNNDGLLDLFIAKGNVDSMPDFANKDPNNLMLQQPDGKFVEVGDKAGVASVMTSRGAAMPDFNLDGLVDLVVVNRRTPVQIWRNTSTNAGHWVEFQLDQSASNRNAIGARLEVKVGETVTTREVSVGGGHAGGEAGFWHFGLGSAGEAMLRVTWPDGTVGDWMKLSADGFYVVRPGGSAEVWTPPNP